MTKETRNPKLETQFRKAVFWHSSFGFLWSFVIRHSSFVIWVSSHAHALFDELAAIPQSSPPMRTLKLFLFLACAALPALAQTNAPESRVMSMEDCVEVALRHNLDVQIQRLNPDISRFTLEAGYGAYDPSLYGGVSHTDNHQPPSVDSNGRVIPGAEIESDNYDGGFQGLLPWGLNYNLGMTLNDQTTKRPAVVAGGGPTLITNTYFDVQSGSPISLVSTSFPVSIPALSAETFSGQAGFLQLRQPLLKNFWIDNTRLQIILNKKSLQISELGLRSQIISTVTAVEQAYYNLIFSQENIKVQQKAVELAEQQLAENKKRVEVGAMAPLDEKQAQSQVASSRADLLNALGGEETQQRVLKSLLSDDYLKWDKVVIQPTETLEAVPQFFSLQESWRLGLSQRPDLLQQKLSLDKQGYVIRYQKNQLFPELDVVGTAGYNASALTPGNYFSQLGGRDNPFYSVGGQISIPLRNTSARNQYKSALTSKDQIALQLKQLEQNIMIQIENDITLAKTRFQQVQATREASVYAEAALDAEKKKLESGKSTSFVVLQLTSNLTQARSSYISALANYNNTLAQLAQDEGSTLDRRHISLQPK